LLNTAVLQPIDARERRWIQAISNTVIQYYVQCYGAVLGLMTFNVFWHLGDTYVRDHDEGRYAVAASEMLHGHSPLITTYGGETEFWNLKPPLGYWLLDLSYWGLGETPFALRVPAAICALLTVALTMSMTRRIAGAGTAIVAGVILTTSFGFLGHHAARSGDLDMPLTLLLVLFLTVAPSLADIRAARLGAGLVLALAFLLKSFAILPFVLAVAVYGLITRGAGTWRVWPAPIAILVVVAATWAVARSVAENSWEFVRRMFVEDLLLRSTTQIDPGGNSGWDYIGALFDRFAPWPIVVLLALGASRCFARQRMSSDSATLLWCFVLIPLAFFTVARTHHSWYIIPIYPAFAILAAVAAVEILNRAKNRNLAAPAAAILGICACACEARVATHIGIRDRMTQSQIFLLSLQSRFPDSGTQLHTAFTPSYSERFLLQVVDGFELRGFNWTSPKPGQFVASNVPVLVHKSDAAWSDIVAHTANITFLAQNGDYALVRIRAPGMATNVD